MEKFLFQALAALSALTAAGFTLAGVVDQNLLFVAISLFAWVGAGVAMATADFS